MKRFLMLVAIGVLLFTAVESHAIPYTVIDKGDSWKYKSLGNPFNTTNWADVEYNSVSWNTTDWQEAHAAFGNYAVYSGLASNQLWQANTDLALQKTVNIQGEFTGNLVLNVAIDNGIKVFVNGIEVIARMAEGFTNYCEYTVNVSKGLFHVGDNTISVIAEDHGGVTFFDMKMTGDLQPVPEPGTMILLGSGLAGLAAFRLRRR